MTISNEHPKFKTFLDRVRCNNGIDKLREVFQESAAHEIKAAIDSLNHEELQFPSLFVLQSDIENIGILDQLSDRNQIAIEIVKDILSPEEEQPAAFYRLSICDHVQTVQSVLRWMLETGNKDSGLSAEYDQVIDTTATLLISVFGDRTILPLIVDLIFARHEQGLVVEYLIQSFFDARDPHSLGLIADRLRSSQVKQRGLARRLLAFIPEIDISRDTDGEQQYWTVQRWLEDNSMFLYFQGETFDMTSKPIPYIVIPKAKYLGRFVSIDSGEIVGSLTEEESQTLEEFEKLEAEAKIQLATHSAALRRQSLPDWNAWLCSPLREQLKVTNLGGSQ